jgi:pullulanase/glycogen debranching enzyme
MTTTFAQAALTESNKQACERTDFQSLLIPSKSYDPPARGIWLNARLLQWPTAESSGQFRIYYSARGQLIASPGQRASGADGALGLEIVTSPIPNELAAKFSYLAPGVQLMVNDRDVDKLKSIHRAQTLLVREDSRGLVLDATGLQKAAALDDLYQSAGTLRGLGVTITKQAIQFKLWAPTARSVSLCLYEKSDSRKAKVVSMRRDERTGSWKVNLKENLSGSYYLYLVDVYVPKLGLIRNRVTDPYSISLSADSKRSYIADLSDATLKPEGWELSKSPRELTAQTDMVVYELHVRDFSWNDASVPLRDRGKFKAFTHKTSNGMKHLRALAEAGLTDLHLLPVFDIASIPEVNCEAISPTDGAADGMQQQAVVERYKDRDCYNWGYDPLHYSAPEGSYSSNADDGAVRIREFRQMVQSLHSIGLRVGMDVVYNHTPASGQHKWSVLDRVVPGYYHRLNSIGEVETSTCCANTATEHMMMAKLMSDSVSLWAKQYKIDSFRFDLMGHQPRSVMETLQQRLKHETGRDIYFIGEGWNFGEVANGARFVQASQLSLQGSGIATFNDRSRDALRGGAYNDKAEALVKHQGYLNGMSYDSNTQQANAEDDLRLKATADRVRAGLAGSLRDYQMTTYRDVQRTLSEIDYAGQSAGYVAEPTEVVNYVENHDNETLFDINAYKLAVTTSREDRARVQVLGMAATMFSQGIAYFHAGIDILRSKSMDRNSYNSGDWFNRLDWSYQDNYFSTGLPLASDNQDNWPVIKPLLGNVLIKPEAEQITWTRDAFRDLLRIRASTSLFRLKTAQDVMKRLKFYNTGSQQKAAVIVGHLNGVGYPGSGFRELVYFLNVDLKAHAIKVPELQGRAFVLHPVHRMPDAADKKIPLYASYDVNLGTFVIPERSSVVFVLE